MRKAFWGILLLAAAPLTSAGEDTLFVPWANKFFVPKDPPPVVVHDFGTVPWGTTLTHKFAMTNIYAVPMQVIKDPEVSCGCTRVVRYTQKMDARESGYVDVEMDGRKFTGAKAVTIQVRFGPQFQSTAILQVRAFSRTDVAINPGQVNFQTVALGQAPTQEISIEYTGQQKDWQITGIDDNHGASIIPQYKLDRTANRGTIRYKVSVSLKAEAEAGVLQDQIILRTNDTAIPNLTIPVVGVVQAPLSVVQGSLIKLDSIAVGQKMSRNITLRGNKPFQIIKVDGEGDGLTVDVLPSAPSAVQAVRVNFAPSQPGELRRKLTILTDQKETAIVAIEGTAEAAPQP